VPERPGRVEVSPPNDNARPARSAAGDDSVGYRLNLRWKRGQGLLTLRRSTHTLSCANDIWWAKSTMGMRYFNLRSRQTQGFRILLPLAPCK
jgi:hypothetical protein